MKITRLIAIVFFAMAVKADAQLVQGNYTGVVTPQYICSGSATRLPYVFRATVSGLIPNTKYRYFSQACILADFGGNNSGAGNPIFINGSSFRFSSATSLSTPGGYDSLVTNSQGSYTGWFGFAHSGNARFTAGNYVYPTITLDSAGNGSTYHRFALNDSIRVLQFLDSANNRCGTGIYGITLATPKNIVAVYDNTAGSGRPLSMAILEDDGISSSVMTSLVQYYIDSVDARNGRWGGVIPNVLAGGVRRINVHRLSDASLAAFITDADGIWPSGVNTVNPSGGSASPVRLTTQDIPLTVAISNESPGSFSLDQNYPNPFNPSTTIRFDIPEKGSVMLKVFDVTGREVSTLLSGELASGSYETMFSGQGLNSGVYFCRLYFTSRGGIELSESIRLLLIK